MSQDDRADPGVAQVMFVLGTTTGGTGRHVRSLAAGLAARGVDVTVAGPAATQRLLGFAGARFLPVEIADRPRPAHDVAAVVRLRRLVRHTAGASKSSDASSAVGAATASGPQGDTAPGGMSQDAATQEATTQDAATQGGPAPGDATARGTSHDTATPDGSTPGSVAPRLAAPGSSAPGLFIVHAHGLRAGAVAALALGGIIFRHSRNRRGPVFVVTLHNAPPAGGGAAGAIYGVLERIVARRADRVLCVSGDLAARMRRRGARSAGDAVVPAPARPAVSADTARAVRAGLGAAGRPVVFACGRLTAQKGFATLLDATGLLRDCDPQPLVIVAGSGPLHGELARRIDPQRLPLRLVGQRDDVPALLACADVFVLPSLWEGQPLILQEALRAGAAIVASRTGGIPDLTGPDAALLVPPGDAGQLAAAVRRVLAEPGLAKRLSLAAARRARSLPDEDAAVDAVLADYRRAAGGPQPDGAADLPASAS